MVTTHIAPVPCRVAVCREALHDGNEWSIYVLNDVPGTIDVIVEQVAFEWGDFGHSQAPGTRFTVPADSVARVCRVDGGDAELSMSLTLRIATSVENSRVSFELGKLYSYRDPTLIAALGTAGWLRSADECRLL